MIFGRKPSSPRSASRMRRANFGLSSNPMTTKANGTRQSSRDVKTIRVSVVQPSGIGGRPIRGRMARSFSHFEGQFFQLVEVLAAVSSVICGNLGHGMTGWSRKFEDTILLMACSSEDWFDHKCSNPLCGGTNTVLEVQIHRSPMHRSRGCRWMMPFFFNPIGIPTLIGSTAIFIRLLVRRKRPASLSGLKSARIWNVQSERCRQDMKPDWS